MVLLRHGYKWLGAGLSVWCGQYTVRGEVCRDVEMNLKETEESKLCLNVIGGFGIGSAAVSCRPAAQVSCLIRLLLASKDGGLEANAK